MKYAGTLLLLLLASPALAEGVDVTASGGFLCEALVNGAPISSHSQYHKAQESATNAELANPAGETEIRCNNSWRVEKKPSGVPFTCVAGETMPAGDGCNTCTCQPGNAWHCTAMLCGPMPEPEPTPDPAVLPGPAGTPQLTADPEGIRVTWNAGSDATEYLVTWGHNDGSGSGNKIVKETTTVIPPLTQDGFVCVRSKNIVGVSVADPSCNGFGPPGAPGAPPPPPELKANLTWSPSPGATGYRLFTGTVPGFGGGAGIDLGNVANYTATGFTAGTTHYFRVSAYNNTGESKQSNEVSKTF